MPEKMQKFLVTATMTTDLVLVVEAPEGTDPDDVRLAAKTLDGGIFHEPEGYSGGWSIDGARVIEESGKEYADAYNITTDILRLKAEETSGDY